MRGFSGNSDPWAETPVDTSGCSSENACVSGFAYCTLDPWDGDVRLNGALMVSIDAVAFLSRWSQKEPVE